MGKKKRLTRARKENNKQKQPHNRFKDYWLLLTILIIAIIGLIIFLKSGPKTAADYAKSWPLIPLSKIPKTAPGQRPHITEAICQDFVPENSNTWVVCMGQVIGDMPDVQISQAMQNDFLNKRLSWSITPNGQPGPSPVDLYASFGIVPASMIQPGRAGELPVITINGNKLAELRKNPEEIYNLWLVLGHEYLHWVQWENAKDQEEKDIARPKSPDKKDTPRQCRIQWQNELAAYEHECQIANSWGIKVLDDDLCPRVTSTQAFKQKLFLLSAAQWEEAMPECLSIWAKEAGY